MSHRVYLLLSHDQYALYVVTADFLRFIADKISNPANGSSGEDLTPKQQQKKKDYEARKEHSNSGSNTHSGQGMEYVTRKTHSSRKDEEGHPHEIVHGGTSGNHKKV